MNNNIKSCFESNIENPYMNFLSGGSSQYKSEACPNQNSREKTGYPTQKPIAIMNRIIKVHSNENDKILDFFAGSGSTGEAAIENNRNAILIDNNPQAISTMKNRFKNHKNVIFYENL